MPHTSTHNKACFQTFKTDVSSYVIPEKLNFPFYYEVNELCKIAANELQQYIKENLESQHDFGLKEPFAKEAIGKMFGVLVVEKDNELGYLVAYSGKLANSNEIAFFVPPVFDMLKNDGYFLKEELVLNGINKEIDVLASDAHYVQLKNDFESFILCSFFILFLTE